MEAIGTTEAMEGYREVENECINKIRIAKRRMERDLASNPDKNNRKFAKYVRSKTKSKTTIGPFKTVDGRLLTQDTEMADKLNQFFASVFTRENSDHHQSRREKL
jgi:hypothetical protein